MKLRYSIYEAKAKLSEIIRLVKKKRRITITERGRDVARVVPVEEPEALEERLLDLEAAGVLSGPPTGSLGGIRRVERRPGALGRLLEDRE
ncbi:MAG: type II toxin-antitoxin system Phd/YefM family antitoxin [Planctomycetota bacterium]